jgi:hypothetical protein
MKLTVRLTKSQAIEIIKREVMIRALDMEWRETFLNNGENIEVIIE